MPHRDDFDDDLMDPSSDAYDYKPVSSNEGGGGKAVKLFLAVTVLAGLAGGAWYFVGSSPKSGDDVPVVRAPEVPTKEKPDDPGGMTVPNRDKTVYQRVSGENTEPKLERLLPRAEQPLEKPVAGMALPELKEEEKPQSETVEQAVPPVLAQQPQEQDNQPALPDTPSEEMAKEMAPPPPAPVVDPNAPRALVKRDETQVAAPTQQDKDDLAAKIAEALNTPEKADAEQGEEKVQVAEKAPDPVAPPPQSAEIKPIAQSGFVLQLLSSKSESGVEKTWDKIKKNNADLIGTLPAEIVKADLGAEKGIYYRLRLGPVQTGDQAKDLCSELKKRKVGCFIVRVQ